MNLEQTAASLLEQFPTSQRADLRRQERVVERFGQIAFGGFIGVILIAMLSIIYLIITRLILTGQNFWSGLLLVAFILFAGLTLTYVYLSESLKEKRSKLNPRPSEMPALGTSDPAGFLGESKCQPIESVTENTTELLGRELRSTTKEL